MNSQKVVLTGVSSFVGMHLVRTFNAAGWDVIAVTSRSEDSYQGIRAERLAAIADEVEFAQCDLTNSQMLGELIVANQPDLWVQHAGYAENYGSLDYDLEKSMALNVDGLEPLYQHLAKINCGVILTGTSSEYTSNNSADREDDECLPYMPYGVSKLAGTIEAERLAEKYNVPTRVARLYIPVGLYDAPGKLIDSIIKALQKGESIDLSPCTQQRDFLGVDDIASAYLKLADDLPRQTFDIFNVCSGEAKQLRGLIEDLCSLIGADLSLLKFGAREMRPGEPMVSFGDNSKMHDVLDWRPYPLEDTLKAIISESQT